MSIATGQAAAALAPAAAPKRAGLLQRIVNHRADYLYVLPALVVMLIVIAYPIYYTIELSFFKTPANLQMKDKIFVGLDNYVTILTSESFRDVTDQHADLDGLLDVLRLPARPRRGAGAAPRVRRPRRAARACCSSPTWSARSPRPTSGSGSTIPTSASSARSSVQLGLTDKPINFLDNIYTVLPSLIVVNIWKEFSFAMIMLMAGLQTVPDQLLRAAQVDGASAWQRFWHVTFPHLKGVSMVTVLLLMVANFNSFIIPWIMTGGGPAGASDIWITQIYQIAFGASALGRRLGLFGDPVHRDDDARLLLREGADARRRVEGRMSARSLRPPVLSQGSPSTGGAGRAGSSSSSC